MKVTPCRTVLYRSRAGVDMPAIVTALDEDGDPFLTCFPPPGAELDLVDHRWGVPEDTTHELPNHEPKPGHWRWPPRESA